MYKAAYERNIETCVVKFSGKSVIDCCDNEEYWPQNNYGEFMWFESQGVILNVGYKMKDPPT